MTEVGCDALAYPWVMSYNRMPLRENDEGAQQTSKALVSFFALPSAHESTTRIQTDKQEFVRCLTKNELLVLACGVR